MNDEARELLCEALAAAPSDDEDSPLDFQVEMMGDLAFDWIFEQVNGGRIEPAKMVRGLRLLSRLTRQFCLSRKGQFLDLLLGLATNPEVARDVRSWAAFIAGGNVRIARGLVDPTRSYVVRT